MASRHREWGQSAAPAAACWTLSATISATWISSGSTRPGEHQRTLCIGTHSHGRCPHFQPEHVQLLPLWNQLGGSCKEQSPQNVYMVNTISISLSLQYDNSFRSRQRSVTTQKVRWPLHLCQPWWSQLYRLLPSPSRAPQSAVKHPS